MRSLSCAGEKPAHKKIARTLNSLYRTSPSLLFFIMLVILVHIPTLISPLDAAARDTWLLDRTLGQWMESELVLAGLRIERAESFAKAEAQAQKESQGAFILADSVACSRIVLRRFVKSARKVSGPTALICALPRAKATDAISYVDGLDPAGGSAPDHHAWTAPFYFVRGGVPVAQAQPLILPYWEHIMGFPLPPGMLGRKESSYAFSNSYLCNVSHWVHVQRVNTSAMFSWWYDKLRGGFWLGGVSWFALRALLGFPWTGGRLTEALNAISWGAQCHHSATIELSVVQKGAKIGPQAIIRGSFIAAGARVANGARVINSVIGTDAFVAMNSSVFASVVYPGALAAQLLMQGSVLGYNSCAFTNSGFQDINFMKNVHVPHRGRYVDCGLPCLGVCIGPHARVSAGVWVASGREIPSGTLLVKPNSEVACRVDDAVRPGEPAMVQNGIVVPFRKPLS